MGSVAKKILCLSTGDVNGAYEAMYRIAIILQKDGHDVKMLVKSKSRPEEFIVQYQPKLVRHSFSIQLFQKIKRKIFPGSRAQKQSIKTNPGYSFISVDETSENISAAMAISQIGFVPDVIISGMTSNFLNSTDLLNLHRLTNSEIYNITVDMNHFSGGCHYAWDCKGYIEGCDERCPAIIGENGRHLPRINFDAKYKNAKSGNFKIIAGSGWTLKQAKESKIYKDQIYIPNINSLIDTNLFNATNKDIAKRIFSFDPSKFYIFAGSQNANDPRKGFEYFVEALKILKSRLTTEQKDKVVILVVSRTIPKEIDSLALETVKLDFLKDYRLLALMYQAVDLFVNSSIEDAGPMMVSEALACGTPVVGFDMGVVNNMVVDGYNGYKAILKDSTDLALGIEKILLLPESDYRNFSQNAVKQVAEFSSHEYASSVFSDILNS